MKLSCEISGAGSYDYISNITSFDVMENHLCSNDKDVSPEINVSITTVNGEKLTLLNLTYTENKNKERVAENDFYALTEAFKSSLEDCIKNKRDLHVIFDVNEQRVLLTFISPGITDKVLKINING